MRSRRGYERVVGSGGVKERSKIGVADGVRKGKVCRAKAYDKWLERGDGGMCGWNGKEWVN